MQENESFLVRCRLELAHLSEFETESVKGSFADFSGRDHDTSPDQNNIDLIGNLLVLDNRARGCPGKRMPLYLVHICQFAAKGVVLSRAHER